MSKKSKSTEHIPGPVESDLKKLGKFIRWARQARQIPIREMAKRTMVSPSTVVRIEKGDAKVAVGTIFRMLYVLGLNKIFSEIMDPNFDPRGIEEVKKLLEGRRFRTSNLNRAPWDNMDF